MQNLIQVTNLIKTGPKIHNTVGWNKFKERGHVAKNVDNSQKNLYFNKPKTNCR